MVAEGVILPVLLMAPLTFPLPSKLCPQIVLAVCNLVAVAALPEQLVELPDILPYK